MRTKRALKIILPVILLAIMGAGGTVRGDDDKVCLPPAWSLKIPASERFELVLDGEAVLDWETGLVWEKSPETTTRSWSDAISYAYKKELGGRKGWRLPTIQELASLLTFNAGLPSGHPFIFAGSSYYNWSSTSDVRNYSTALVVFFGIGIGVSSGHDKSNGYYAWCVRGGHGHDVP